MRALASAALVVLFVSAAAAEDIPLRNWPVQQPASGKIGTNADISGGAIFVAITPCRLVDTRGPAGPYGGPVFSAGQTRTFDVTGGPCTDLPAAAAFSMNFTIVNYDVNAGSFVTAYPAFTSRPFVSTVNFGTGPPVANAAIVPTTTGLIDVFAGAVTHLVIDVNGYFADGTTELNFLNQLTVVANVPAGAAILGANTPDASCGCEPGPAVGAGVTGYTLEGSTWGAFGITDSLDPDSGGVLALAFARVTDAVFPPVGLRADSDVGPGALGLTSAGDEAGVHGAWVDINGDVQTYGLLGTVDYGVFSGGDTGATGTKNFVDPHPTDASKVIRYVSLEGPEAGTYFRGRGRFAGNKAVIEVPESFRMVTEEEGLTVHVTPMGGFAQVAVMKVSLDGIVVEATNDVEFTYIVHGVRRGYKDYEPIGPGHEFRPRSISAPMPAYLNASQKKRLVENGTYNADGTVNLETAVRLGWEKMWKAEATRKERPETKRR